MNCRHCSYPLVNVFLDLGFAPPSNAYLSREDLIRPETSFPLKIMVCDHCWLVQTIDYTSAEDLFNSEYAYFSSTSNSWLTHAAQYAERIISKLKLNQESYVVEIASNDGYLLEKFRDYQIPCLGVEPTYSTALSAESKGIPVLKEFFTERLGKQLASQDKQADLLIGNNVYAHVPDINDFTKGLREILKPEGTITLEFPHLMQLITQTQFDTVYHEHFSYLSLYVVVKVFESVGLRVYDVERLSTHGGSLRIYGCHEANVRETTQAVSNVLSLEEDFGLQRRSTYQGFQEKVDKLKIDLLTFLIEQKRAGKKVVGYGAAAKGNTLLNYAGVKQDLLPFVCDAALSKQGKYLPGSHIPILPPVMIQETQPDFILILPWNISKEIVTQLSQSDKLSSQFVTAVPSLEILS